MDEAEAKRALRALRGKADRELLRLEEERQRLQKLIRFIDEYATDAPGPIPKPRHPRKPRPASLLDIIRERPGIRTSMLALITERPSEEIAAELTEHEGRGEIRREALGWRIA